MNVKLFAAGLTAVAMALLSAESAPGIRGFSPAQAQSERSLEAKVHDILSPLRVRAHIQKMSAEPHAAGQPASRAVAEYALGLFREWGYDAHIEEFEALLPYPTARQVELTAPVTFKAKLEEPAISEDPDSSDKGQLPTFNAYSASGDVTAPVVYVNYGVPEDYEQLAKLGVDVKGRIVIARYGKSWRGTKAKVAQEHGAAGCLIYSDPKEDGFFQGDVYPKGPYRPRDSVQRGSIADMPVFPGDPLSPGWASEKGSRRLTVAESPAVMKIQVQPLSWNDAKPILENLGGPVAPEAWRGALPLTYHIGAGPATVHLKLDFDWTSKPVYDVIATMPGAVYPDEWVIYGNHHDAWVNGANDPISGAAALLETARALGELRKQGWKPKRTIRFALWDAEEFGLIGSTEWVEKHQPELDRKAVVYFNSDTNAKGTIGIGASPLLESFTGEILRDTTDPASGKSLLDTLRPKTDSGTAPEFTAGTLGAGSDYVAFFHHAGIASVNAGFSGPSSGGVYHSIYDSYRWYSKFEDPDFEYGKALADVMSRSILRMADADVLPFEFEALTRAVVRWMDEVRKLKGGNGVQFDALLDELKELKTSAQAYEARLQKGQWQGADAPKLAAVNSVLMRSERALAPEAGMPGRTWYKHQLMAPGLYTGYSAKTLPAIREAAEVGRIDEANKGVAPVVGALRGLRNRVDQATAALAACESER
jgi:N-acetylated-alpha-linked acidic dipeptidase